jgi:hypothetical protein
VQGVDVGDSILAGGSYIDHADVLRAGATSAVLGHRVMASSTLGTFLRSVTFGQLRQLEAVNAHVLARAWATGAGPADGSSTIDLDPDCTKGIGIWDRASTDAGAEPDVVLGCAGDVPTMETLAAVELLRGWFPDLRIRVVNVVDLMRLQDDREHPHGLADREFDALFTTDQPSLFAHHGYPWLIHRLTYRRTNHHNMHVRGYVEEGTTTTPFDMCVLDRIDRFNLVIDVLDGVPRLADISAHAARR